jgi:hypothetical protein
METADLAFVNFSAGDHGAENCFIRDSGIDRSALHQCCGHAMAPTESHLELGVGIDPSLREFAVGNQISARGVRLPHYKSASAGKSICGNRDAASMGFSPATKLCVRSLRFQS